MIRPGDVLAELVARGHRVAGVGIDPAGEVVGVELVEAYEALDAARAHVRRGVPHERIPEALRAQGFRALGIKVVAGLVEGVDVEGANEALAAAREIVRDPVFLATQAREKPSPLDALILRASGLGLGAELEADVEAVLTRAGNEILRRLS